VEFQRGEGQGRLVVHAAVVRQVFQSAPEGGQRPVEVLQLVQAGPDVIVAAHQARVQALGLAQAIERVAGHAFLEQGQARVVVGERVVGRQGGALVEACQRRFVVAAVEMKQAQVGVALHVRAGGQGRLEAAARLGRAARLGVDRAQVGPGLAHIPDGACGALVHGGGLLPSPQVLQRRAQVGPGLGRIRVGGGGVAEGRGGLLDAPRLAQHATQAVAPLRGRGARGQGLAIGGLGAWQVAAGLQIAAAGEGGGFRGLRGWRAHGAHTKRPTGAGQSRIAARRGSSHAAAGRYRTRTPAAPDPGSRRSP